MISVYRYPCIQPQGNYNPLYSRTDDVKKSDLLLGEFADDQSEQAIEFGKQEARRLFGEVAGDPENVCVLLDGGRRVLYESRYDDPEMALMIRRRTMTQYQAMQEATTDA